MAELLQDLWHRHALVGVVECQLVVIDGRKS